MSEDELYGAWRLTSATGIRSDGKVIEPYGPSPKGSLIYTPGHRMNAIITDGNSQPADAPDESGSSNRRMVAYFGSFEVDDESRTVTHHVEGSLFQDWEGRTQVRHYELSGDRLTLRTPPIQRPRGRLEFVLVWER